MQKGPEGSSGKGPERLGLPLVKLMIVALLTIGERLRKRLKSVLGLDDGPGIPAGRRLLTCPSGLLTTM